MESIILSLITVSVVACAAVTYVLTRSVRENNEAADKEISLHFPGEVQPLAEAAKIKAAAALMPQRATAVTRVRLSTANPNPQFIYGGVTLPSSARSDGRRRHEELRVFARDYYGKIEKMLDESIIRSVNIDTSIRTLEVARSWRVTSEEKPQMDWSDLYAPQSNEKYRTH